MTTVLIVEDDDTLRDALADTIELAGYDIHAAESGMKALEVLNQESADIVVSDVRMDGMDGHQLLGEIHRKLPGVPVILITAHGSIQNAVDAMQNGAVDYILKPFEPQILLDKISRHALNQSAFADSTPIVEDPKSQALMALALKVSTSDATVLISGESGTGKEVLARYIHDNSTRNDGPFIAINCAAIPEQMLEATLFGYEKGAFTGAYKATPGKFEQAQGGTLLLDEISEMDLNLQVKLLRVLQEKEVERIGSNKMIPLNVRVLATTNRDLKEEIAKGRFREDLYYRINVFPLHWIPLRERQQDILPVARYLIARHWTDDRGPIPSFSAEAERALLNYSWPGNAREMDNVIQRALILISGNIIQESDLHLSPESLKVEDEQTSAEMSEAAKVLDLSQSKKQHEFDVILDVLKELDGNRKKTSEKLGISERNLRYKLAKMRELGYEV